MKQLELEEQENCAFDELWEKDVWPAGRGGWEDARKKMDFEHKLALDQQVSGPGYRNAENELADQEAELMRKAWDHEREEAKKVEAMRHEVLMKANAELHEFNKHKRAQLAESVAAERKADAERLAAQLALEAHEHEREAAARESMQHETRRFAEHMMQKRAVAQQEEVRRRRARLSSTRPGTSASPSGARSRRRART